MALKRWILLWVVLSCCKSFADTIAFHRYRAYDRIPGSMERPLDGQIEFYELTTRTRYSFERYDRSLRHLLNPKFSKNGRFLTFMALPQGTYGDHWRRFLKVYVYDFIANHLYNITQMTQAQDVFDEDPDFSPDSSTVIFKRNNVELWQFNCVTQESRALHFEGLDGHKSMPAHSPDGEWLAFAFNAREQSEIYRFHLKTEKFENIAGIHQIQHYYPTYLTDFLLLYVRWKSALDKTDQIYVKNLLDGKEQVSLCQQKSGDHSDPFRISEDWIGFSLRDSRSKYQIYRCQWKTGYKELLISTDRERDLLGGAYSPLNYL